MTQPTAPPGAAWPPPPPPMPPPPTMQGWRPVPAPPKPERPLKPAIWWSVLLNVIQALGMALLAALVVGFFAMLLGSWEAAEGGDPGMGGAEWQIAAPLAAIVFGATLIVNLALTIGALLLLRLAQGFRTLHPFVQALLAWLAAFLVSNVLSAVLGIFSELASGAGGLFGTVNLGG